ncbi:HAD family hydrolase [Ohessyouella blattaphilus]|uniref:HAD family hydrolase n=1 Tax=Ohessyouella blattaphilus TaxID=2949333 RepID=UPI00256AACB7|nr:HAD family phosphatase [Lachnospiraceae bacterium OttesenSCG-928-J05]
MKTVIFDLDGVMFDTEVVDRQAWLDLGAERNLPWIHEFVEALVGTTGSYIRGLVKEHLRSDEAVEEFMDAQDLKVEEYYREHQVRVKKGLYELLEYLQNNSYKVGIASSGSLNWITKNITSAGVENYFDVIVSGDLVTKSKPNPEIFLLACEKLKVEPKETWVIEDSKNGIHAARAAGCRTIFIPDLWHPENPAGLEDVDYHLEDLNQVIPLLEKIEA